MYEVHQQLNSRIYQVTRVYNKEKEHAELEFTIGPIPIDNAVGKEITTQITTSLRTNKTFYTDSNGRDFFIRVRDFRTSEIITRKISAFGSCSRWFKLVDGQIELMLHRKQ